MISWHDAYYWTLLLFINHSEVRAIGVTRQCFFGKLYALIRSNQRVNVRPSSRALSGFIRHMKFTGAYGRSRVERVKGFWTNPLVLVGGAQPQHKPDTKLVALPCGLR